jgi:hypothetical protein
MVPSLFVCVFLFALFYSGRVYVIGKCIPPPGISIDVIWGEKYEEGKMKRGKM